MHEMQTLIKRHAGPRPLVNPARSVRFRSGSRAALSGLRGWSGGRPPRPTPAGNDRSLTDDPRPVNPSGVGYALTDLDSPINHQGLIRHTGNVLRFVPVLAALMVVVSVASAATPPSTLRPGVAPPSNPRFTTPAARHVRHLFKQNGLPVRSLGTTPDGTSTLLGSASAFSVTIAVYRSPEKAVAWLKETALYSPAPRTRMIRVGAVVIYVQYVAKNGPLPVVPWRVARAVVALRHGA